MSSADAGDFLAQMAAASARRVADARTRESAAALAARARSAPPAPRLTLSAAGFDLIAELKLRSPAAGVLAGSDRDLEARVGAYARAGAAAVSVLTEPERFGGSLAHLVRAAVALAPAGIPAMRKDFLVDPYQLLEARAAGAGGVLLIVRMLARASLAELADAAAELGLFVLLEAFDADDAGVAGELAARWRGPATDCLLGINSRDLVSLAVVPERLEALGALLPRDRLRVAESGLATPADAARLAASGFSLALVGSALMTAPEPEALAREMIARGREAVGR